MSASQLVSSSRGQFGPVHAVALITVGKTPANVGVSTWTNAMTAA